jgi:UTP:GlnB (protein PII) uridylyltransferase
LAAELDVGRHTVQRALQVPENEGVLGGYKHGRSRSITDAVAATAFQRPLRIAILRHDASLVDNPQTSLTLIEIMHSLEAAAHSVFFCKKSQTELKRIVPRITRQLAATGADAWVDAVRKGKPDRRIINIPTEFVPGGSVGPVWKE